MYNLNTEMPSSCHSGLAAGCITLFFINRTFLPPANAESSYTVFIDSSEIQESV